MIRKLYTFFQKETVLSISVILAVFSMFWIKPDHTYISYIDFRTLGLLFCLMTIVAGLKEIGVFDFLAEKMLSKAHGTKAIVTLLVLLCFFFSMVITNDVALITFVPLALIMLHKLPEELTEYWLIKVVVMQTIAANLGSMLTPIGNPQNLYLYAQADMSAFALIRLMLPYSVVSLILLLIWIRFAASKASKMSKKNNTSLSFSNTSEHHRENVLKSIANRKTEYLIAYLLLFAACLLTVAHILDFRIPLLLVVLYVIIRDHTLLGKVDYSLLATFTALFIFIGNLGRISQFSHFLSSIMTGRETITAILASQVMSNVPAAILLSGFANNYTSLIIGTNIGGLGTLIASMASLISFKYIAKENPHLRGKYFTLFTVANILFLAILLLLIKCLTAF